MESSNLDRFFATMNAELNAYKRFEKLAAPQLAPDFNMISCLCPDENRLSKVIAMLLDPNGEHGQGNTFIHLFLNSLEEDRHNVDSINIVRKGLKTGRSRKFLEAATYTIENCQRRIDILIEFGDTGLAIENKPWASDQEKQIDDYISHLGNRYPGRFLIIYLSGNGGSPGEESITAEKREKLEKTGHFLVFSYRALGNWIRQCAEKSHSVRVRSFLEDFASYITLEFDGGLSIMEEQLIIEQATKKENIGAAFAIAPLWQKIATKKIEELAELVKQRIDQCFGPWEMRVKFKYFDKDSGFYFYRKDKWNRYRIAIAFEEANVHEFSCGITKEIECGPDEFDDQLAVKLNNNINKDKGYPDSWWAWWQYFEYPYRDWRFRAEPWEGIYENGNTVNEIVSKLEQVIKCVADEIDIIEDKLKLKQTM